MEWKPDGSEAMRLWDDKGRTEGFGDSAVLPGYLYDWDRSLDLLFATPEGPDRPEADLLGQAEKAKQAAEAPRRIKGWIIEGRRAIARPGARLWNLAEAITGDGNDWRKLNFPRRPETLRAGEVIDIGPLLAERTRREVLVAPPAPAPERVPAPAPLPGPTPETIARARDKHWRITGNKARALSGANLENLAWVITGNAQDWRRLNFKRDPRTLKAGDVIDIGPLLGGVYAPEEKAPESVQADTPPDPPKTRDKETIAKWLEYYAGKARRAKKAIGHPVFISVQLAQMIQESGYGRSRLFRQAKNIGGIKARRGQPYVTMWTGEHVRGRDIRIEARFAKYFSFEEGFREHGKLIKDIPRYRAAAQARTPEEQIRRIHKAGYATDPNYAISIIKLINKYDLKRFDTAP